MNWMQEAFESFDLFYGGMTGSLLPCVVVVMKAMMGILRNTGGGRAYIPPYKLLALMMKDEKAKKTELALKLLTF